MQFTYLWLQQKLQVVAAVDLRPGLVGELLLPGRLLTTAATAAAWSAAAAAAAAAACC